MRRVGAGVLAGAGVPVGVGTIAGGLCGLALPGAAGTTGIMALDGAIPPAGTIRLAGGMPQIRTGQAALPRLGTTVIPAPIPPLQVVPPIHRLAVRLTRDRLRHLAARPPHLFPLLVPLLNQRPLRHAAPTRLAPATVPARARIKRAAAAYAAAPPAELDRANFAALCGIKAS